MDASSELSISKDFSSLELSDRKDPDNDPDTSQSRIVGPKLPI